MSEIPHSGPATPAGTEAGPGGLAAPTETAHGKKPAPTKARRKTGRGIQIAVLAVIVLSVVALVFALVQRVGIKDGSINFNPNSAPFAIQGEPTTMMSDDGFQYLGITAVNQGEVDIEYCEFVIYGYNADGTEYIGPDGFSWSVSVLAGPFTPGKTYKPQDAGYMMADTMNDAAILFPVVRYIQYTDGSTWGYSGSKDSAAAMRFVQEYRSYADAYAQKRAG